MQHNGHRVPRASEHRVTALVQAALDAAEQGHSIFPCDRQKRPMVRRWQHAATRDARTIRHWFSQPGAALIGTPTGAFIVIDIDTKNDAHGMAWLDANRDALPPTRTHRTRSGGLHLCFLPVPAFEVRNSQSRLAPGVDVRGIGGFVIMPPSLGYTVEDAAPLALLPIWLARACVARQVVQPGPLPPPLPAPSSAAGADRRWALAALRSECDAVRRAPFGEQEFTLNKAALCIGRIVGGGSLTYDEAFSLLFQAGCAMASEEGREPWTALAIRRKLEHGLRDGMQRPRVYSGRTR